MTFQGRRHFRKKALTSPLVFSAMLTSSIGIATANVTTEEENVETGYETEKANLTITQVVGGLEHPWAVAWLPDGMLYVVTDEEDGGVYRLEPEA